MSLGQSDQLRSPGHFPGAVLRYTLREMSLVWYMYGGNDFESTSKKGESVVDGEGVSELGHCVDAYLIDSKTHLPNFSPIFSKIYAKVN